MISLVWTKDAVCNKGMLWYHAEGSVTWFSFNKSPLSLTSVANIPAAELLIVLLLTNTSFSSVVLKTSFGIRYTPGFTFAMQLCECWCKRRPASSSKWSFLIVYRTPTICLAEDTTLHPEGYLSWQPFSHLWIGTPRLYLFKYFFI